MLHDQIDSDPNEESKSLDTEQDTLMIIAENNRLNLIDQAMQYVFKEE